MSLNENSKLRGQHALFSPSQPSWLNYDDDEFLVKLVGKYRSSIGTEIHEWASAQIELCHKLTSVREIIKDVETHIYEKFFDIRYGLSDYGTNLLKSLKYVQPEVYDNVKSYVNDCVGFKMQTEVLIDYTDNFFGTADAIKFDGHFLRVHDLKTGSSPAHIEQLLIYEALYLLKYKINPESVSSELRIYQNNEILAMAPTAEEIRPIMDRIVQFDILMTKFQGGTL